MSQLILTPKVSEKAVYLAERRIYIFEVPADTNKLAVSKAVESAFKVDVTDVNIIVAKGKLKRFRNQLARERDTKKAYVKLKSGQSIKLFEGAN